MRMSMDAMFTLELLLVAVVIIIIVAGAVYLATRDRRTRRETGRKVGTADAPVGTALSKETLAVLEGDAEEQRQRDRDIIVRYDRDALAEKARLRLRDVGHTEDR